MQRRVRLTLFHQEAIQQYNILKKYFNSGTSLANRKQNKRKKNVSYMQTSKGFNTGSKFFFYCFQRKRQKNEMKTIWCRMAQLFTFVNLFGIFQRKSIFLKFQRQQQRTKIAFVYGWGKFFFLSFFRQSHFDERKHLEYFILWKQRGKITERRVWVVRCPTRKYQANCSQIRSFMNAFFVYIEIINMTR